MNLMSLTAVELGKKIKDKEVSVEDAEKAALAQIKSVENDVIALLQLMKRVL